MGASQTIYERSRIECLGTIRVFLEQLLTEIPKATHGMDWRVKKLQEFIDAQDGKAGWDLDEVCRELGLGICGTYAGKLFKRAMGMGLREYAMKKRLKTAADRLTTTTCSIKEIAGDLGYRSPRDLARGFHKTLRLSPTQCRRMYRLLGGVSS